MDEYNLILFDLDGTLTDPGEGIRNSVAYALEKYGIEVEDILTLNRFIGPPLAEGFQQFYGFSTEQAAQAVSYYREYYQDYGIFENCVYKGIPELLELLRAHRKTLAVATSKPEVYAKQILKHYGLEPYFDCVVGGNLDGTRCKKHEVIAAVLEQYPASAGYRAVMVGDREHDIIGARQMGLDSVGVLFGYGSAEELNKAQATALAATVADIATFV